MQGPKNTVLLRYFGSRNPQGHSEMHREPQEIQALGWDWWSNGFPKVELCRGNGSFRDPPPFCAVRWLTFVWFPPSGMFLMTSMSAQWEQNFLLSGQHQKCSTTSNTAASPMCGHSVRIWPHRTRHFVSWFPQQETTVQQYPFVAKAPRAYNMTWTAWDKQGTPDVGDCFRVALLMSATCCVILILIS